MKIIKQFGVLFLLLSILLSTGGVSVYKHYCGDFLASFSLYAPADDCTDMGDEGCEGSAMDCCDNETEYYAAELDLFKHENKLIDFDQYVAEPRISIEFSQDISERPTDFSILEKRTGGPPLYILNSSLTYYG